MLQALQYVCHAQPVVLVHLVLHDALAALRADAAPV